MKDLDFGPLGVRQVLAIPGVELGDRVFTLLYHLVDDREHIGVGHFLPLVNLALLDRGQQQPDRRQARGIFRAERRFHVVGDAGFE